MNAVRWIDDQPYGAKTPFWTRANAGEVLPVPPSPAGWDLVFHNGGSVAGWRDCAVNRLGVGDDELSEDPDRCEFIGLIGGYAYLGATWIRVWAERTPGMTAAAIDQAYFGDHPDVPPYVAEPWHENPATTQRMVGWLGWVMGTMEQTELEADRVLARQIRTDRPDLGALTDAELLDRAVSLRPMCRRMFDQHISQSGAASIGPGTLGAICAAIGRSGDVMRLMAGQGGVDSAAPSYAMWDLGRKAAGSPAVGAMFEGGPVGLNTRLRGSDDPSVASFVADLDPFVGHDADALAQQATIPDAEDGRPRQVRSGRHAGAQGGQRTDVRVCAELDALLAHERGRREHQHRAGAESGEPFRGASVRANRAVAHRCVPRSLNEVGDESGHGENVASAA